MTNVLQIQRGQHQVCQTETHSGLTALFLALLLRFKRAVAKMPLLEETPAFTGQPETHTFAGVLFDMDGTIVDSTDAIVKHWHKFVVPSKIIGFPGQCSSL